MSKVCVVSLGCSKNLVDSEKMLGAIRLNNHELIGAPEFADIIIVNTCCFIDDAKQESLDIIMNMATYKQQNCKALLVVGCMAQRYQEEILDAIPEIDCVMPLSGDINKAIESAMQGKREVLNAPCSHEDARIVTTPLGTAYLKIAEGCNNHCTYCVIPSIRGEYESYPKERILHEARTLAKQGVRELIVIAQDTTAYDDNGYKLPDLLKDLCDIPEIAWVRVHYCYPERVTDELIKVMQKQMKICRYIDIPIQHCNDEILKKMARRTNKAEILALIDKLRKAMPEITIRTTLIVGFPGETEEQFNELYDFVRDVRFERLGVFEYSPQEGTPAAKMDEQISDDVKRARRDKIMHLQEGISLEVGQSKISNIEQIMIEGAINGEKYIGRTPADSLEIDGQIIIKSKQELMAGDMVCALITNASGYDLEGEIA